MPDRSTQDRSTGGRASQRRAIEHPHLEQPSHEAIRDALADRPPAMRELFLATHDLIRDAVPDVAFEIDQVDGMVGYARHQFGYGGWGGFALACHARWVSVAFFRGSELPDPDRILEGTGKRVRHVKIRSAEELEARASALRVLLAAAIEPAA